MALGVGFGRSGDERPQLPFAQPGSIGLVERIIRQLEHSELAQQLALPAIHDLGHRRPSAIHLTPPQLESDPIRGIAHQQSSALVGCRFVAGRPVTGRHCDHVVSISAGEMQQQTSNLARFLDSGQGAILQVLGRLAFRTGGQDNLGPDPFKSLQVFYADEPPVGPPTPFAGL